MRILSPQSKPGVENLLDRILTSTHSYSSTSRFLLQRLSVPPWKRSVLDCKNNIQTGEGSTNSENLARVVGSLHGTERSMDDSPAPFTLYLHTTKVTTKTKHFACSATRVLSRSLVKHHDSCINTSVSYKLLTFHDHDCV